MAPTLICIFLKKREFLVTLASWYEKQIQFIAWVTQIILSKKLYVYCMNVILVLLDFVRKDSAKFEYGRISDLNRLLAIVDLIDYCF